MPGGKQNRRSRKQRPRKSRNAIGRPGHLPQLREVMVLNYRQRYQWNTSGGELTLEPFQLISSIFCAFVDATHVMSTVNAIRIKQVDLWTPPGAATADVAYGQRTCRLAWVTADESNPNFGRDMGVTDTSLSLDSAHVTLRPVPGSTSMLWQTSSGNQPWELHAFGSIGSVLDISFQFTLQCLEAISNVNASTVVANTPSVGLLYMTNLVHSGFGTLVPQVGNYIQ